MTRKRTRESLAQVLCETCPTCEVGARSRRRERSVTTSCAKSLREARQFDAREFRVVAEPEVVDLFLDEEKSGAGWLSDFIGKPVSLQAETAMGHAEYDIVLM